MTQTSSDLNEAKQAYDLEVKENNVPQAISDYIALLEKELSETTKKYEQYNSWWTNACLERADLTSDIQNLQAEIDYLRSVISHSYKTPIYASN